MHQLCAALKLGSKHFVDVELIDVGDGFQVCFKYMTFLKFQVLEYMTIPKYLHTTAEDFHLNLGFNSSPLTMVFILNMD